MTKRVDATTKFKRDVKIVSKQGYDLSKLYKIVNMLREGSPLPQKNKPHKLTGNWSPKWECHIEPDWLLIYEIYKDKIVLYRTGSHSELF